MNATSLDWNGTEALRETLLDAQKFAELVEFFISKIEYEDDEDSFFQQLYTAASHALAVENAAAIAELAQSPIERIFLSSLVLGAIKGGDLLSVHHTYEDTTLEVADFRKNLASFNDFIDWFSKERPTPSVQEFLEGEVKRGEMPAEELRYLERLVFKYHYLPLENSIHMTLQPRFPQIRIGGKSIRPDIYFWVPSRPDINVIVECDGFKYHSDRHHFISDRQRDRALTALGYEVLRFSGTEIFKDPVAVAVELSSHVSRRLARATLDES